MSLVSNFDLVFSIETAGKRLSTSIPREKLVDVLATGYIPGIPELRIGEVVLLTIEPDNDNAVSRDLIYNITRHEFRLVDTP